MKLIPVDQHPEIIPLDLKIRALAVRRSDLEKRLQDATKPAEGDDVDKLREDPAASLTPREDPEGLRRELKQIGEANTRLQQERSTTVSRVSQQVCREHAAEHRKRVQRILQAGRELTAANASIVELFDELETKGYSAGFLRMMQFLDTGNSSDPQSPLSLFEAECREYGFLDRKSWLSETVGARG